MVTLDYLRWFGAVADRYNFDYKTRAVYEYLLEHSLGRANGKILTSGDEIADALKMRRADVTCSLTNLRDKCIIKTPKRGSWEILPPPITWTELKQPTSLPKSFPKNDNGPVRGKQSGKIQSSPLLHAREKPGLGSNPPKGGSSPQGGNLPPPQKQAKALSARQQLDLYKKLGWVIPIELTLAANSNPDEPWVKERK